MKWVRSFLLTLLPLLVFCQSCQNGKTPQSWFDLTWAGLAGVDEFQINGTAEVVQPGSLRKSQTFSYLGHLKNHTELSIKVAPAAKQQKSGVTALSNGQETGSVNLHLMNGSRWTVLEKKGEVSAWTSAAAGRLNPLAAIEELRFMKKSIREEKGAARGTRVLRIEPDPEQELLRLKNQLLLEMNSLGADWQSRAKGSAALQAGNNLIGSTRQQLAGILEGAEVNTVYHLTLSKRSNLPLRMTSETKISYRDALGLWRQESLWNDAKFSQYR